MSGSQSDTPRIVPPKKARVSRPGLSVLAQGEPMIWLSGGALALSLVMIFGLLALIVSQGLASFWPGRLERVELKDGTVLLGERTAEEQYAVEDAAPRDAEPTLARRWQYRIDNFEFQSTGSGTYRWVNEFELAASPTHLEWAVLFERTKMGRFLGMPVRFLDSTPRPISGEETELAEIQRFFTSQLDSLEDEAAQGSLEDELATIRQKLDSLQAQNTQTFLEKAAPPGDDVQVVLEDGTAAPLAERTPEQNVIAIRQTAEGAEAAWEHFQQFHAEARERARAIRRIAENDIGECSHRQEEARFALRREELDHDIFVEDLASEIYNLRVEREVIQAEREQDARVVAYVRRILGEDSAMAQLGPEIVEALNTPRLAREAEIDARLDEIRQVLEELPESAQAAAYQYVEIRFEVDREIAALQDRIAEIDARNERYTLVAETIQGEETQLKPGEIVRAVPANQLDWLGRLGVYFSRWWEFISAEPREANSEGGVFPAIWGTVAMTMIMSLIVVPFGVLAALYLREYAKRGPIVSIIRISINNLAGVPSIVFGVFGYGFLILVVGAYIDGGPRNANLPVMPETAWWLTAAGLAMVAFVAFMTTTYSLGSRKVMSKRRRPFLGHLSLGLWIVATLAFVLLIAFTPDFHGFYRAGLPNPTFGKGCLLWASLTLALLTLPVVIVATEEALSAVPNSLREGSYGCGASKWQTIRRIILPHALPGIMTGMILAMARGAGEVAPLMLVGVLKMAPELPIDTEAPFIHLDRSFMHLGFHIFDLGFQSPNSEAAKPMVFTTTLLLIVVIAALNLLAIWLRARLRKRFQSGQF